MPQLETFSPATSWLAILGLSTVSLVGCMKFWTYLKRGRGDRVDKQLLATLQSEIEEIRNGAVKKDEELACLRSEKNIATEEAKAKNDMLTMLRGEFAELKNRFNELDSALEDSHRQNRIKASQLQRQSEELQAITDESQQLKLQHAQALDLLKTRTSELKGAQTFLTKADSLSGADVIGLVEGLNTEVSQAAAFMADSFEFEKRQRGREETAEIQEACARVSEILGDRMAHLLKWTEHTEDPMLIQIAFQSSILGFSEWLIDSWYFEEPENDHFLQEIYGRVRESEDQAVAGRWRALTRRHVQRMARGESEVPAPLITHLIEVFTSILVAAGCKQSKIQIHDMVVTRFIERLTIIGRMAIRLSKAAGEEITSCELEVAFLAPDTAFNHSTMNDTFGKDMTKNEPTNDKQILCTTDLGLVSAVKQSGDGESRWRETILLKPRVLLLSSLEEAMAVA